MRPEKDRNFEQYLTQLVSLLKKMMKSFPLQGEGMGAFPKSGFPKEKESDANVNFFLFNFLPMLPEDLEEMEELLENQLSAEDELEILSTELNRADVEFLRKHGIRF